MATARPLMIVPAAAQAEATSLDALIARYAIRLSGLIQAHDAASWELATLVTEVYTAAEALPDMVGKTSRQVHQEVNIKLRKYWDAHKLDAPRPSRLSHAARVYELWPEVFAVDRKNLPLDHYERLAICSLPREQKEELRTWAETEQPRQVDLRQRIRKEVDEGKGVYRPDFDLKVSNHWMFNGEKRSDEFVGGVNKELYANLIHFFSDPGNTILDPFAGGGVLAAALTYQHFQEVTKAEHSGPRYALMSDIKPIRPDIVQADVRFGLPFDDQCVQLAILDPPYLTMAAGKYAELGKVLTVWQEGLRAAMTQTARCLTPDGILVVMTDDHLRRDQHIPLGHKVMALAEADGWKLLTTIYNFNRNFLQMTPGAMAAVKHARFLVNAVKIIMVMQRAL
jgi:hypothetical protein